MKPERAHPVRGNRGAVLRAGTRKRARRRLRLPRMVSENWDVLVTAAVLLGAIVGAALLIALVFKPRYPMQEVPPVGPASPGYYRSVTVEDPVWSD